MDDLAVRAYSLRIGSFPLFFVIRRPNPVDNIPVVARFFILDEAVSGKQLLPYCKDNGHDVGVICTNMKGRRR